MENSYCLHMVSLAILIYGVKNHNLHLCFFHLGDNHHGSAVRFSLWKPIHCDAYVKDFKRAPELKVQAVTPSELLTLLRRKQ